ncbi:MAG: carboxypeptidase M32 [Leptospiraceae bacterium]|nr:carboxypeptidase M32 [Leptospiraceae bacterium]MCP5499615.1 carboxypeptidase M32 [Leptospiraceae bacterium]
MEKNAFTEYRKYWKELVNLQNVISILHWDSEVTMPPEARPERAGQIAQLSALQHKNFTGNHFLRLIDEAEEFIRRTKPEKESFYLREIEVLRKERNRAVTLPVELVEKFSQKTNLAHGIWESARKNKNFKEFEGILSEIVELSIEMAECYGYDRNRYDALLEGYETGINVEKLDPLFMGLKNSLIPMVNEAREFPNPFKSEISERRQELFNRRLPAALGLPEDMSRLDKSSHPFSTNLGRKDFRITTRYDEKDPISSIMGVLHESGHSLYEMGVGEMEDYPSPLTASVSFGIHESQSRLWENQIGRSRAFWEYYYPSLCKDFEINHYDLPFEDLYNYLNSSAKTKIRVEADQLTYNLHIILRYEIEKELISEGLPVRELPERWNAGMKELFDLQIHNDAEGVLQDVHWSGGGFGYFPTYTLGNIYSAQFFHKFLEDTPDFWKGLMQHGDLSPLSNWLKKNIHLQGKILEPDKLIEKVCGARPKPEYLVKYLKTRLKEFF